MPGPIDRCYRSELTTPPPKHLLRLDSKTPDSVGHSFPFSFARSPDVTNSLTMIYSGCRQSEGTRESRCQASSYTPSKTCFLKYLLLYLWACVEELLLLLARETAPASGVVAAVGTPQAIDRRL